MEPPVLTWRAGSGYIPAPYPQPQVPIRAEAVPPTPIIPMAYHNHQYYLYPPGYQYAYVAPAPAPAPAPAASVASKKSSSSSSSSSKKKEDAAPKPPPAAPASEKHDKSANAPPKLRAGQNYMFPPEHTKLHIFNKSSKVWEDKHKGKFHNFKIFTVATTFTPAMVVENVLGKRGDDAKGWAVTEVVEKGDGAWAKGTTIEYGGERAGSSLASMGWSGKRGEALPPVWVVVHKV